MTALFELPVPTLSLAGEDATFPVRRIYCVGRNYADHAREMGHNPDREPPFFFGKPRDAVVASGATIPYPASTSDLHYEIELVVAIGEGGADIPAERALDHVFGYAVGIDLTRRDLQAEAKKMSRPWEMAKGFDRSAPISPLRRASDIGHPGKGRIWLKVNGETRQDSDIGDQIWPVTDAIAYLSRYMRLEKGDLLMTGTPAGVGALRPGDTAEGGIDGIGEVRVTIAR